MVEIVEFKNKAIKATRDLFKVPMDELGGTFMYTVHDKFRRIVEILESQGYVVETRKFCGSPGGEDVKNGFPKLTGQYSTRAHGGLDTYRASGLSVGRTFDLDGQPYVLVYNDRYHGCAYTPGHQWMIAVKLPTD